MRRAATVGFKGARAVVKKSASAARALGAAAASAATPPAVSRSATPPPPDATGQDGDCTGHVAGGTKLPQQTRELLGRLVDPLSTSFATARIPVNVAKYLVARERVVRDRLSAELRADEMSLAELLELRDMCCASTAAYVLARMGATSLDAYLAETLPGYRADLRLSDDDHVVLVNEERRQVYFSCRGTDGRNPDRKRRDVLAYYAIIRCRQIDPRDHSRLAKTLRNAAAAYERYAEQRGFAFRCVGHSFGGFAATVCAQELDCGATNFNGPVYRPQDGVQLQSSVVDAAVEVALEERASEENAQPWPEHEQSESSPQSDEPPAPVPEVGGAAKEEPLSTAGPSTSTTWPQWPHTSEGTQRSSSAAAMSSGLRLLPAAVLERLRHADVRGNLSRAGSSLARRVLHPSSSPQQHGPNGTSRLPSLQHASSQPQSQAHRAQRTVERRGHVHHVQVGNDVVSLVGGAFPSECEQWTRLEHVGHTWDFKGAHLRRGILCAIDRVILQAAEREGVEGVAEQLRRCPDTSPPLPPKPARRVSLECPWEGHDTSRGSDEGAPSSPSRQQPLALPVAQRAINTGTQRPCAGEV